MLYFFGADLRFRFDLHESTRQPFEHRKDGIGIREKIE